MMSTHEDKAWAKLLAKVDAKSADYAKQNAAYRAKYCPKKEMDEVEFLAGLLMMCVIASGRPRYNQATAKHAVELALRRRVHEVL